MNFGDEEKNNNPDELDEFLNNIEDSVEEEAPDSDVSDDEMIEISVSEHKKLLDEVQEHKDKYVRLCAEFDNVRKRMDRDKAEFMKYANEGLIIELLDILDNFQRAVEVAEAKHQDYDAFLKGMEMVNKQMHDMLSKNGVKPIEAKGQKFDPHSHEVLLQEETEEYDDGVVMEELQKGYILHDRVVRTVKVKLAKAKE